MQKIAAVNRDADTLTAIDERTIEKISANREFTYEFLIQVPIKLHENPSYAAAVPIDAT
jgi:hypothetical protein